MAERALARVRLRREHSQLLSENLEFARSQALYRQGLQLLATLDGERLQDLALSVLARVTDAQGAALWTADERGAARAARLARSRRSRGAAAARSTRRTRSGPRRSGGGGRSAAPGRELEEAFLVPLLADDEPVGARAPLRSRRAGGFGAGGARRRAAPSPTSPPSR